MAFYSLVPFEDQVWLIKADESQALDEEQLAAIDAHLKQGKALEDIQDVLNDAWNKK